MEAKYIEEVMATGDRLPPEEAQEVLLEEAMQAPVFDGEKVVDAAIGAD